VRQTNKRAACVTAVVTILGSLALSVPAAHAVGGDCSSYREKKAQTARPDAYRVRAICRSLDAESKARGVLVVNNGNPDYHTAWFTGLNTNYYSDWHTVFSYDIGGTKIEFNHV
jgi:hypothetical protein